MRPGRPCPRPPPGQPAQPPRPPPRPPPRRRPLPTSSRRSLPPCRPPRRLRRPCRWPSILASTRPRPSPRCPARWRASRCGGPAPAPARPGAALRQGLQDQRILILGLGASGRARARWCLRCGAQVPVADTRAAPPQLPALQRELPRARFVPGAFDAGLLEGQNLHAVYCSPGLSPCAVAAVAQTCSAHGIGMGGELDLYALALAGLRAADGYAPTVLAITGTNGKTTVTALTGQLLQRAGRSVALAGNIGPTLLDTLAGHIDAGTLP